MARGAHERHVLRIGNPAASGGTRFLICSVAIELNDEALAEVSARTTQITAMIFLILIGATLFSLVFRGLGGDEMVHRALADLPGGTGGAVLVVMVAASAQDAVKELSDQFEAKSKTLLQKK